MRRVIAFLLFVQLSLFARIEESSHGSKEFSGQYEPLMLVDGCIDPISGIWIDQEIDLELPQAGDFNIKRTHYSLEESELPTRSGIYNGDVPPLYMWSRWGWNHAHYLSWTNPAHWSRKIEVANFSGQKMILKTSDGKNWKLQEDNFKSWTNSCGGLIGASLDPHHICMEDVGSPGNHLWKLSESSGLKRYFCLHSAGEGKNNRQNWRCSESHREFPSGLCWSYRYDGNLFSLKSVDLKTQSGQLIGTLEFKDKGKYIESSTGDWVKYELTERYGGISGSLYPLLPIKVIRSQSPTVEYEYKQYSCSWYTESGYIGSDDSARTTFVYHLPPHITCKRYPDGRYRRMTYLDKYPKNSYINLCCDGCTIPDHAGKISAYLGPVGPNGQEAYIYQFHYHANQTHVWDPFGNKKAYCFDADKRLCELDVYEKSGHIDLTHHLRWSKKPDEGRLEKTWTTDDSGNVLLYQKYSYDKFGNIIQKQLYTKLNTDRLYPRLNSQEEVTNLEETDLYTTTYEYIQEPFHLKTAEIYPEGKKIEYVYVPNSDRLAAELTSWNGKISERKFWFYDEFSQVSLEIKDDGQSCDAMDVDDVHQRLITYKTRYNEHPHAGLLETEKTYYLDLETRQEVPLLTTTYTYDLRRHLQSKKVEDHATGVISEESMEHDAHGNCTKFIDARGAITLKEYDTNDNMIREIGPLFTIEYAYDLDDRLIEKKEIHTNPHQIFKETYEYDALGRQTVKIDAYGVRHEMSYDYEGRLLATSIHGLLGADGQLRTTPVVTSHTYDRLGREISSTDELGFTTEYTYNGQGHLLSEKRADGHLTEYTYDIFGRLVRKSYNRSYSERFEYDDCSRIKKVYLESDEGSILSLENFYEGALKVRQVDALGHEDRWTYDGAGRILFHERLDVDTHESHLEAFTYDGHDRQISHRQWQDGSDYIEENLRYDEAGDLIESYFLNSHGALSKHIEYEYDSVGNKILEKKHDGGEVFSQSFVYNSHGECLEHIDEEGIRTEYIRHYLVRMKTNDLQTIVEKVKPYGDREITYLDSRDLITKQYIKNASGITLQKRKFGYDAASHLVFRLEKTLSQGESISESVLTYVHYGPNDQIQMRVDAVGSSMERPRTWSYDAYGYCQQMQLPSGLIHYYSYDAKGRLVRSSTSDGTIDYRYTYDHLDRPLSVDNALTSKSTQRTYDAWGQITRETLENNLTYLRSYNGLGQVIRETYSNGSEVIRTYQDGLLQSAARGTAYQHTITNYNDWNQAVSEQMPFELGMIERSYDMKGRLIASSRPYHRASSITYDDRGRLVQRNIQTPSQAILESFSYDSLDQLVQQNGFHDQAYEYDSRYRRLRAGSETYQADCLDQLKEVVKESGPKTQFTYDLDGRLTHFSSEQGEWQITYDGWSRPIRFVGPAFDLTYSYDAFDRRLSKDGQIAHLDCHEQYGYIDQRLVTYRHNDVCDQRYFIRGDASEHGDTLAWESAGNIFFPILDTHGSTIGWLNQDGELQQSWYFDAFGLSDTSDSCPALGPFGFGSKFTDRETGFIYFGRRYYVPTWGQWLSRDPKGEIDSSNLYAYVLNNPLNKLDLWGLESSPNASQDKAFWNDAWNSFKASSYASWADSILSWSGTYELGKSFWVSDDHPESWSNLSSACRVLKIADLGLDVAIIWARGQAAGPVFSLKSTMRAYKVASIATKESKIINQVVRNSLKGIIKTTTSNLSRSGIKTGTVKAVRNVQSKANKAEFNQVKGPFEGTYYHKKVLNQMRTSAKTGERDFHGFPLEVDNYAKYGETSLIKGKNGIEVPKITLRGSYNGHEGEFEWIIDPDQYIRHRMFRPNKPQN